MWNSSISCASIPATNAARSVDAAGGEAGDAGGDGFVFGEKAETYKAAKRHGYFHVVGFARQNRRRYQ
jgi:hypothetical protein